MHRTHHETLRSFGLLSALGASALLIVSCVDPPGASLALSPSPDDAALASDREPSFADAPHALALFGDEPISEQVPTESRLVTNLTQHSFTTEGLDFDPDFYDADGLLVFASTRNNDHADIFVKRADGYTLTQLTGDPADDIQPRFSPDGRRVVFASDRAGNWDIWSIDRDGRGETQLTREAGDEMAPCWSPDGRQIAYTARSERSHQWEIWVLDVDQPGVRRFLAYGMFPAWSTDGKQIAFQRSRQRGDRLFSLWTVDVVDGEARHPTEVAHSDVAACVSPRWSPDGKLLVYCLVRDGKRRDRQDRSTPPAADLWVVDLTSGVRMKVTDGADVDFNPVWSADGRIFFVSARGGTENIWSLTTALGGSGSKQSRTASNVELKSRSGSQYHGE